MSSIDAYKQAVQASQAQQQEMLAVNTQDAQFKATMQAFTKIVQDDFKNATEGMQANSTTRDTSGKMLRDGFRGQ